MKRNGHESKVKIKTQISMKKTKAKKEKEKKQYTRSLECAATDGGLYCTAEGGRERGLFHYFHYRSG